MARLTNIKRVERAIQVLDELFAEPLRRQGVEMTLSLRFGSESAAKPDKPKTWMEKKAAGDAWVDGMETDMKHCLCEQKGIEEYLCKMHVVMYSA